MKRKKEKRKKRKKKRKTKKNEEERKEERKRVGHKSCKIANQLVQTARLSVTQL